MTPKVHSLAPHKQASQPPHLLDTLETSGKSKGSNARETLVRRTLQKVTTVENTLQLIDLRSPLEGNYWKTWHCGRIMLQEGEKFTMQLCRQKWCRTCAHIRTAHLVNGYKHLLEQFQAPHMVVLTMKNCKGRELQSQYQKMIDAFRRANKAIKRKHGIQINGIRTWECTFNEKTGEYHPHFNVVVDTHEAAVLVRQYWMEYWVKAQGAKAVSMKAQHVSPIRTAKDLLEVFKYSTKMAVKHEEAVKAQDWIYRCTKGKRLAQAFGTLKKMKTAIPLVNTDVIEGEERIEIWGYEDEVEHYVNGSGETLVSDAEKTHYIQERIARKKAKEALKNNHLVNNP